MSTLTFLKWKDSHGHEQKFRLINRVSAKWLKFGYCLGRSTNQLEGWEEQCILDADRCWCKVMGHWLKEDGTPDYPTTWKGVFCLLEDVECLQVAQDLQKALASVIPPPPPLPPLPACTCDTVAVYHDWDCEVAKLLVEKGKVDLQKNYEKFLRRPNELWDILVQAVYYGHLKVVKNVTEKLNECFKTDHSEVNNTFREMQLSGIQIMDCCFKILNDKVIDQ